MPVYVPGGVQVIPIEAIIGLSTSITNLITYNRSGAGGCGLAAAS